MHEYGIVEAMLENITKAIENNAPGSIATKIYLRVGALSGINPGAIENAYPMAVQGTPYEKAELIIKVDIAKCRCRACENKFVIDDYPDMIICEECGGTDIEFPPGADKLHLVKIILWKDDEETTVRFTEADEIKEKPHEHPHEH